MMAYKHDVVDVRCWAQTLILAQTSASAECANCMARFYIGHTVLSLHPRYSTQISSSGNAQIWCCQKYLFGLLSFTQCGEYAILL